MVDLPCGDDRTVQFITNVGLLTSTGPNGPNIMACEWTHHISYKPGLVAVFVGPTKATNENIRETKEFGVSLAATDQNVLSSVAGGRSGREINKIEALKELGFKFYKGKKIEAPMVSGAVVNIECKLARIVDLGDHTMFVGEVLDASLNPGKEPLAYHKGAYWKIGENIQKPDDQERERIKSIIERYKK